MKNFKLFLASIILLFTFGYADAQIAIFGRHLAVVVPLPLVIPAPEPVYVAPPVYAVQPQPYGYYPPVYVERTYPYTPEYLRWIEERRNREHEMQERRERKFRQDEHFRK